MEIYDILFSDLNFTVDSTSSKINSLIEDTKQLTNRINRLENEMANLSLNENLFSMSFLSVKNVPIIFLNSMYLNKKNNSDFSDAITELFNGLDLNIYPVKISRLG